MPKKLIQESVLHDWVHELTFQMQALLLTAMRGPDENNKYNAAKAIIRYLRGAVIKPAGDWNGENNNDFMWAEYDQFKKWAFTFWQDHDEYPHHFIMHLVHCAEIVGYFYPIPAIAEHWKNFYWDACDAFHMNPETKEQLKKRLNDFGRGIHNGDRGFGKCQEGKCEEWASKDYNGHGHYVCERHYDKLSEEFDNEYK